MASRQQLEQFLSSPVIAVVGASTNRSKFGNKVLRCYLEHRRPVIPVHPLETEIEGLRCLASVTDLPLEVESLSVITPPQVTEKVVQQAVERGIKNIWMQPGSESVAAIRTAEEQGVNVIADGACVLVELGFSGH